jgi:hypothetical protein
MMTVLKIFGIFVLVYVGLSLLLVGCQRKMIYYPSHDSEERLLQRAQAKGMSAWRNADGELIGFKASAPENATGGNAVVVFHGNAGYALHRDYIINGFLALDDQQPWTIYIFEYPGYGAREGQPSEKHIKATAGEAVAGLFNENYDRLFLVGESIGTGVATHLAEKFSERIKGILLITPFTSLVDVGKAHYPIFPIGLVLRERYDNLESLKGYDGPVAFLIAEADEIVTASLGHKLYEAYSGPKKIWIQEGRRHNTLNYDPRAPWWKEVVSFLQDTSYNQPVQEKSQ